MMKKMLVAYNQSPESEAAFNLALDLARQYKSELNVLSVVRLAEPPMDVETEAELENAAAHYKQAFNTLRKKAKDAGMDIKTLVVNGHPVDQILHEVEKQGIDVLVMGHQSRGKFGKWFTGAVTDRVVDHAPCTVIVVKRDHR